MTPTSTPLASPVHPISRAIYDRYRCPERFLKWELSGALACNEGYFRLGPNTTCFGRTSAGYLQSAPKSTNYDALSEIEMSNGTLSIPFDPSEVIENYWLERYCAGSNAGFKAFLKTLYYVVRPLMGVAVRSKIQKFRARNWKHAAIPKWPVDTAVEDISERLLSLSLQSTPSQRIPFIWFWPQGASACITMTHDVETEIGRDFCGQLMDLNDSFGIKSSFQVIPERRYEVPQQFLESIRSRGFEVAVHDLYHDGRLYDNREEFLRRVAKINGYLSEWNATGFRAGALYRNTAWFADFDFAYDMSIPNVGHLDPQFGGCCTLMPYFIGDKLEIPLTMVQDYMLFHILNQRSVDLWKQQLDIIVGRHGLASFIVHPDYIIDASTRSVYRELLDYLQTVSKEQNLWVALPKQINQWWRDRSQMTLVEEGGSWRIIGPSSERAVVAYASLDHDELSYQLERSTAAS